MDKLEQLLVLLFLPGYVYLLAYLVSHAHFRVKSKFYADMLKGETRHG